MKSRKSVPTKRHKEVEVLEGLLLSIQRDVDSVIDSQARIEDQLSDLCNRFTVQQGAASHAVTRAELVDCVRRELEQALTRHLSSFTSTQKTMADEMESFRKANAGEGLQNLKIENAALKQQRQLVLTALGVADLQGK